MKLSSTTIRLALGVTLLAVLPVHSAAASGAGRRPGKKSNKASNWPQWRGPESQGISTDTGIPTEWSNTTNVQWKTPLPGKGHSSPIVWGKYIFLTTSVEGPVIPDAKPFKHILGNQEFKHPDWAGSDHSYTLKVLCVEATTGKLLWERTAYEGGVFDHRHKKNTYASPTAATDGHFVFAFFGSEGLYCYDFKGKQIWKVSLGGIPQLGMGPGASPVVYENLVIVTCDQDAGDSSYMVALDKKTGKEVWRITRKARATWATPVLVKTAKRVELVVSGAETVVSYDPVTGKEIWRCEGVVSHAIPTPVTDGDVIYLSAGSQAKKAIAVRLGGSGDLTNTPNVIWKYEKGTAYVPSPILYGEYLYLMTDKGLITCIEARTGKVVYEGGRVPVPTTFTASPVAFDGKILLTSEDGDTFVLKAGPAHEVLRTNSLGEPIYASPAIAGGKIYIRGEKNLYCIANRAGKA
jgi:outer membrane protein assembly factor BamB